MLLSMLSGWAQPGTICPMKSQQEVGIHMSAFPIVGFMAALETFSGTELSFNIWHVTKNLIQNCRDHHHEHRWLGPVKPSAAGQIPQHGNSDDAL